MGDLRIKLGEGLRLAVMAAMGLVCLAAGAVYAQAPGAAAVGKTVLVEPPAPLLPPMLGKLTRVSAGDVGDGLGSVDAADAAVLKEDGLRRFARSEYKDGVKAGTVTVYKFVDASGAISAYDYFLKPGMRPEKLGDDAVSNGDALMLRSGVNLVRTDLKLGHETTDLLAKDLIVALPKVGGTAALAPLLPTLLPVKGINADSVKYALGPAGYAAMGGVLPADTIGFDKSAEVVTAKLKNGGVLTLLLYPTPQIAGDHGRAIQAQAPQEGKLTLRRDGPLVVVATGMASSVDAQKLVGAIHLDTVASFDKPMPLEFHAEVKKTYSLLVSITIFCGIAALAAVVLALFFGGGRALVRVMQGKPAASEPEFLRIDLRGEEGKGLRRPKA